MVKKHPFQVVLVQLSRWSGWLSATFALTIVWAAQPLPVLAADRTVLCEEFTNET